VKLICCFLAVNTTHNGLNFRCILRPIPHCAFKSVVLANNFIQLTLCFYFLFFCVCLQSDMVRHANSVSTILRCLSKAPRLPALDWGTIIRRCMRYGAKVSAHTKQSPELLREECICFSLAHANDVSSLLHFLDELTDLSRFTTLELSLQSTLLYHLSDLLKIFSGSRLDKLSEDLVAYLGSSVCPYLSYDLDQRILLRVSFWKGLRQCLNGTLKESMYTSKVEKCMECLFCNLSVLTCDARSEAQVAGGIEEWSEAIRCLSRAPQGWLMDMLQVFVIHLFLELSMIYYSHAMPYIFYSTSM